jgi:tetratricopeptide (TPR) repeat protein
MATSDPSSADLPHECPGPGVTTRRLRELSQLEFELDLFARVLERDPVHLSALRVHANNLAARGFLHRALQIDRRIVRLQPDRAIPWYNLACSYAVLGMIEPAFEALERSIVLGYSHIRWLCRDPDLKPLRLDPRYSQLLRRAIVSRR